MRLARVSVVLAALLAVLVFGPGSAWAATTIDSVSADVNGDTNGEVTGASDCTQSLSFSDSKPFPAGGGTATGPFSFTASALPQSTPVSCSVGSGDNTASASLTTSGSISGSGLTLTQQSQGTTTGSGTAQPPNGCIDFGGSTGSSTSVVFTITQPESFSFSGTFTTTQKNSAGYSLTRTSPSFAKVFDQTTDSFSPNDQGTLQPGTYQYRATGIVGNDVGCASGSLTDSFNYDLHLVVGGDHYQVEFKAWIAQPHVVDPYQPVTLPTLLVDQLPLVAVRPRCDLLTFPFNDGLTSTSFRGDGHDQFAGSYRTDMIINFDWDGSTISNFQTSGNNFGTTTLDFHVTGFDPLSPSNPFVSDDCTKTGMATQSAVGAVAFGGKGFLLALDAADPLVSPQFAVPALDGRVLGLFNTQNNQQVLTLQFQTDIFPSFGVEITRDGVVQATSLINDTSCMDPNSVLGPAGVPLLAFGLSSITQNSGQFTLLPTTTGATSARSSDLCSFSYDTLQLINSNLSFPAGDVGGRAANASQVLVAPAGSSHFVPLAQALKQGLLAGVQHPGHTYLLVDPRHPVRIEVLGRGAIVQAGTLTHGHTGKTLSFGPVAGTLVVSAGKTVTATLNGHKLKAHKPDRKPPRTTATVKVKGKFAIVHLTATDGSGVAETILVVAGKVVRLEHGSARIKLSQLKTVRYWSIDTLGNIERPRRLGR